jgi:hypothetical protein
VSESLSEGKCVYGNMKIMKSNEKKEGNKMTHLSIFIYIFNSFFCNVKSFECCNDNNEASESSDDEESDDIVDDRDQIEDETVFREGEYSVDPDDDEEES